MSCERIREALSARLDGEVAGVADPVLDQHLATCPGCRAFAAGAQGLRRRVAVRPAEAVPDLAEPILVAAHRELAPPPRYEWARFGLLAVALTQLVLAVPPLLLGSDAGASIHVARELGSWDIALAVGLLVVAIRPDRAAGLLPFAAALAAAMCATALADLAAGRALALAESQHLLDLVGVLLLWRLSKQPASTRPLVALHRA